MPSDPGARSSREAGLHRGYWWRSSLVFTISLPVPARSGTGSMHRERPDRGATSLAGGWPRVDLGPSRRTRVALHPRVAGRCEDSADQPMYRLLALLRRGRCEHRVAAGGAGPPELDWGTWLFLLLMEIAAGRRVGVRGMGGWSAPAHPRVGSQAVMSHAAMTGTSFVGEDAGRDYRLVVKRSVNSRWSCLVPVVSTLRRTSTRLVSECARPRSQSARARAMPVGNKAAPRRRTRRPLRGPRCAASVQRRPEGLQPADFIKANCSGSIVSRKACSGLPGRTGMARRR